MTSVLGLAWIPAHVALPAEPPGPATLLLGWVLEPLPTAAIAVAAVAWWLAVGRVDRAHPANPVPKRRSVAFFGGLLAIAFALLSGIEAYATTLFSAHMVQHILLTLVAAPLLAMSAPITLLLRVASHQSRRRWILPALHSRLLRFLTFPVVAWLLFAGVMWVTHFSPMFEAALEDPLVHDLEHVLFLTSALLFWLPAVALDPGPWRMPHPVRALYVFMQMPQNTFLAVVLLNASSVLYPHYASLPRPWGIAGAGRPASRGGPDVGSRRRDLRGGTGRAHLGLDAGRGPGHGASGSAGGPGAGRDPRSRGPAGGPHSPASARKLSPGAASRGNGGSPPGRRYRR
ncbi:MAG: cytochrome c oxidase assembly protein [Candidatus Limnocylindrales bacterium]